MPHSPARKWFLSAGNNVCPKNSLFATGALHYAISAMPHSSSTDPQIYHPCRVLCFVDFFFFYKYITPTGLETSSFKIRYWIFVIPCSIFSIITMFFILHPFFALYPLRLNFIIQKSLIDIRYSNCGLIFTPSL
jgi:hypothetical protein